MPCVRGFTTITPSLFTTTTIFFLAAASRNCVHHLPFFFLTSPPPVLYTRSCLVELPSPSTLTGIAPKSLLQRPLFQCHILLSTYPQLPDPGMHTARRKQQLVARFRFSARGLSCGHVRRHRFGVKGIKHPPQIREYLWPELHDLCAPTSYLRRPLHSLSTAPTATAFGSLESSADCSIQATGYV